MRQGQSSKRSRGRSGGRRNTSPRHQSFDSNGPSIRIRGNAHQVYEKYIQLARDANAAGDRITAENMYQHAEHYYRIMNVDDGNSQQRGQGGDQRQHSRNPQNGQDGGSAGNDGDKPAEQASGGNGSDGPNGSEVPEATGRGNGLRTQDGEVTEAPGNPDADRKERQPRRTRRSPNRARSEGSESGSSETVPGDSSIVVEPDAVADLDSKDVH